MNIIVIIGNKILDNFSNFVKAISCFNLKVDTVAAIVMKKYICTGTTNRLKFMVTSIVSVMVFDCEYPTIPNRKKIKAINTNITKLTTVVIHCNPK